MAITTDETAAAGDKLSPVHSITNQSLQEIWLFNAIRSYKAETEDRRTSRDPYEESLTERCQNDLDNSYSRQRLNHADGKNSK